MSVSLSLEREDEPRLPVLRFYLFIQNTVI